MGRFSNAKSWGALDKKLEDSYNQLVDLLDRGVIIDGSINGKHLEIRITPQDIIKITTDDVPVLGINENGDIFASSIAYRDDPDSAWGVIGNFPGIGAGFACYTDMQAAPAFAVSYLTNGVTDDPVGVCIIDKDGVVRFEIQNLSCKISGPDGNCRFEVAHTGAFSFQDQDGNITLQYDWGGDNLMFIDADRKIRFSLGSTESVMKNPGAADYKIGVDATGAYVKGSLRFVDDGTGLSLPDVAENNNDIWNLRMASGSLNYSNGTVNYEVIDSRNKDWYVPAMGLGGNCLDISGQNVKVARNTGFFMGYNCPSAPSANTWWYYIYLRYSDAYCCVIAIPLDTTGQIQWINKRAGTWQTSWTQIES